MGWKIIEHRRDFFIKFPLGLLTIFVLGISPFIVGMIGAWLTELKTGEPCHEGNCYWGAFPWLTFVTFPAAVLIMIVYLVIATANAVHYFKSKSNSE